MARKKMGRSLPSAELATQHPRDRTEHVAGLSPNPATNLLAADIAMRIASQAMRHLAEKGMLSRRYGKGGADAIVSKRSLSASLAGYALTRVATRSVPVRCWLAAVSLPKRCSTGPGRKRRPAVRATRRWPKRPRNNQLSVALRLPSAAKRRVWRNTTNCSAAG